MATLTPAEIEQRIAGGPWRLQDGVLVMDVQAADFAAAMAFADRVGDAAEAAGHHPDILVHGWNHVRLMLSTHSAGAVTEADLALAATIDRIPVT